MTLYLIHGNTWFERYGYEEHIFGVFTSREKAEEAKIATEKRLREEKGMIDDPEDVELDILEVKADELIDEYLGGYIE